MVLFTQMMLLGLVGGIIGWITNYIAVIMLFRPIRPYNFLGYEIQGLIPKRKDEIAISVGKIVENELVSINDIWDKLMNDDNRRYIISSIKLRVGSIVDNNLPTFIPKSFKRILTNYVGDIIDKEVDKFMEQSATSMLSDISKKINIAGIVEEKIKLFELEKLEKIVIDISNKELKMIVILGGILGFIIGIFQAFIVRLL
ncbi:DUF445 family protein [Thermoanaerobacterium sp. RBIITD]|uniref:DUF445 domain-containing protein n=1 Tax=Thermoanaerobacterium sp. RBIITD TaxID=1550240 RepID=UPI000BB9B016|nr:DUF445 family protein [Thermoanaerobacterium sp. RBIITD]SNX55004.1 Protein of unknown function [Thermoanaerobacterium sp. RBIITD]